jgi:hypothetical protein
MEWGLRQCIGRGTYLPKLREAHRTLQSKPNRPRLFLSSFAAKSDCLQEPRERQDESRCDPIVSGFD